MATTMAAIAFLFAAAPRSSASSVFISTFDSAATGSATVGISDTQTFGAFRGLAFTTDSGNYQLASIELLGEQRRAGSLIAQLYAADANNLPTGSPLGSFTSPTFTTSFGAGTFTANGVIPLAPLTTYVFTLTTPDGNWVLGLIRNSVGFTRPDGGNWNYESELVTKIYGESEDPDTVPWADTNDSIVDPASHSRLYARISATVIPEPSVSMFALVSGVLLACRRRRQWEA